MSRELAVTFAVVAGLVVGSPASAATGPVPTIADVKPSSASVRTGSTFTFQVIAENNQKTKSVSYALNFLLSATSGPSGARKVGDGTIPAIAAKTRKTFTFRAAIPSNSAAGDFRVLLCHPRSGKAAYCHDDKVQVKVTLAPAKLTITPAGVDFGSVTVGHESTTRQFTVRNKGRRSSGAVTTGVSGTQKTSFPIVSSTCGASLAPGAACSLKAKFHPTGTGPRKATLTAAPSAKYAKGAAVTLAGTGTPVVPAQLTLTAGSNFGDVSVGSTGTQSPFTVTNVGTEPSGTLTTAIAGAEADQFTLVNDHCAGTVLAGAQTCTLDVEFKPTSSGVKNGTVKVTATPGTPVAGLTSNFAGTGLAPAALDITTGSGLFGDIVVGDSAPAKTFTVTNAGGVPTSSVTISVETSNASQYPVTNDTCTGTTIAAGSTCTFDIAFSPTSPGLKPAYVQAIAAIGGGDSAGLDGTGITPATLEFEPDDFAFNSTTANFHTFTLKNVGDVSTSGDLGFRAESQTHFQAYSTDCANQLGAQSSCTVSVRFIYQGQRYGTLYALIDGSQATQIALYADF